MATSFRVRTLFYIYIIFYIYYCYIIWNLSYQLWQSQNNIANWLIGEFSWPLSDCSETCVAACQDIIPILLQSNNKNKYYFRPKMLKPAMSTQRAPLTSMKSTHNHYLHGNYHYNIIISLLIIVVERNHIGPVAKSGRNDISCGCCRSDLQCATQTEKHTDATTLMLVFQFPQNIQPFSWSSPMMLRNNYISRKLSLLRPIML